MRRRFISSEQFEAEFFPGSKRIAPGIWEDGAGHLHISVPELLELFDVADTPANREQCVQTVMDVITRAWPETDIVRQDESES